MSRSWRLARVLAWTSLLGATAWLWSLDRRVVEDRGDVEGLTIERDVVYRTSGARRATLDVYRAPPDDGATPETRRPAILALHGGSWIGGSKAAYGPQVARFARSGFIVFVADYALGRPGRPSWPEVLADVHAAVRWIGEHADAYGVDAGRIVALGSSAGGHLAMLAATVPDGPEGEGGAARIGAVVSLYGPSDLAALAAERDLPRDPVTMLVGGRFPENMGALREASPIERVGPDAPPMLLIHGEEDLWVPPGHSRRMEARLRGAGVPCRLILIPGARHGFELVLGEPARRDLVPEILDFLESVLQPSRSPSR